MKYKAVIIDDEAKLREVMDIKLSQHCPEIEIVGKISNAEDGYKCILEHQPDLVFLDISMPGESGFDMLKRFDTIDFEIIFATGFSEYALDALKVSAVDYLLKPINTEDLIVGVQRAIDRIQERKKIKRYDLLKHNIQHVGDQKTKIAIAGAEAYQFVKVEDIIRCEGWQKYTKIHLQNGSVIVSSYNIGVYKDMLTSYGFFSSHKSHLINNNNIVKYNKEGVVEMSDGSTVPIARRRKDEFIAAFIK